MTLKGWTEEMVHAHNAKQRGEKVTYSIVDEPEVKPSKYKNIKRNGYDSLKEERRAGELKLMLKAGVISDLVEQPEYLLIPKQDGERKVKYIADFCYLDAIGVLVVEDVKSEATRKKPEYIIKRKLMLQVHGIKVVEV